MAKLSESQLKKLSPEQRKAREKRLAYNAQYDASKRDGKTVRREKRVGKAVSKAVRDVTFKKTVIVGDVELEHDQFGFVAIEARITELKELTEKMNEIKKEIRDMLE